MMVLTGFISRKWVGRFALMLSLLVIAGRSQAEVFAAAASLQPVMEKIAEEFKREKGIAMDGVFGASGQLARQIEMGAPYDFFLSADEKWARYLEEKDKLEGVQAVVECPLVLWWSSGETPSLDLVKDEKIRVAIADPQVAPYGALAKKYLEQIGDYEALERNGRLIIAGDVLKAGLAASSGGADAAYIPLSIAIKLEGSWAKVPMPPQRLYGGVVKGGSTERALLFFDFLFTSAAEGLFREAGFEPVTN